MPDLKLIALDTEDLSVISAHLQDAVLRTGDVLYLPKEQRFVLLVNRFDWANAPNGSKSGYERRRAALRFERVRSAKVHAVDLDDKRQVLALLAITFEPRAADQSPEGDVTLTFSGGAAIRLAVECIEAELKDLGAAWAAKQSPDHSEDAS